MKYEEVGNLVGNIIKNEFKNVQKYEERDFIDTDEKQIEFSNISDKLVKQLFESVPNEYRSLLDDYIDAMLCEWDNLCLFYFKKGLRAGLDNLNFIKEIDGIKAKYVL